MVRHTHQWRKVVRDVCFHFHELLSPSGLHGLTSVPSTRQGHVRAPHTDHVLHKAGRLFVVGLTSVGVCVVMIGASTDHVACAVDLEWPLVSAWVGGVHTHALVNVVSTALKRVDTLRDGGHELTICAPRSLAMFHRGSCRRRGWVDSKPVRLLWRRFLVGPTPPACVFEAHPRARGAFLVLFVDSLTGI